MKFEHSLVEAFQEPPPESRPTPLWWWDGGELDPERLTDQLESLASNGISSVCIIEKFPTGFAGDEFDYFSDDWWGMLEHVVEECNRLNMTLWVHDETYHVGPENRNGNEYWQDKLRTGTTANPALQGSVLQRFYTEIDGGEHVIVEVPDSFIPHIVAAYPVDKSGTLRVDDSREITHESGAIDWSSPDTTHRWHVAAIGQQPKGLCYTDRATAERYIELHFDEYVRRLAEHVGETLVGTFEDEIYLLNGDLPCDDQVLTRFQRDHGYDPIPHLIGLYEETTDPQSIRLDYYETVTALLEECWFQPLYEWHDSHDLLRAHDNWGRNDLVEGTEQYGDYFRTMRWYQAPGYDDGGSAAIGERNFFDAKIAASIATCYNRDRVWGELFHSTGWGFQPADQLAGLVENICYGCSLYDMHGLYYTTNGGWWSHAPGDVHFRQPYWKDVEKINDAAGRLCEVFSRGTQIVDVALLFPITSLHDDWHPESGIGERGRVTDEVTRSVAEELYKSGFDLVIADPPSIAKANIDSRGLTISDSSIPVLVLPPITAIRESTLTAIREIFDAGGIVVAIDRLPTTLHGDPQALLEEGLRHIFGTTAFADGFDGSHIHCNESDGVGVLIERDGDLPGLLDDLITRDVSSTEDLYHTHRRIDELDAYLLFNARNEERSVDLQLRATGQPHRWDPLTGEIDPINQYERNETTELSIDFASHGFELVVIQDAETKPHIVETSLDRLSSIDSTEDTLQVQGTVTDNGSHTVRGVLQDEHVYGAVQVTREPTSISLEDWTFEPVPGLDNRWGDFRYPPSDAVIGPEIRQFYYRHEGPTDDGIEQGWFTQTQTNADWNPVIPTYGPYFWRRVTDTNSRSAGDSSDRGAAFTTPDRSRAGWEPYWFSKTVGKEGTHPYINGLGYSSILSDEFLIAPETGGQTHFWTAIWSPSDKMAGLQFGPGIERIQLGSQTMEDLTLSRGGTDFPDVIANPCNQRRIIHLSEGYTPLHFVVNAGCETHIAVEPVDEDARDRALDSIPRMRWFMSENPFVLDSRPWDTEPIGWYRFTLPIGTEEFTLPIRGEPEVWVAGEIHPISGRSVILDEPVSKQTQIAVRLQQTRGAYGGAAWTEAIEVTCNAVPFSLQPWEEVGLLAYSGHGRYRTTVTLPELNDNERVFLNLGEVHCTAAIRVNGVAVGRLVAQPFELEVTAAIQPGDNEIEILVSNTLANHFSTETPRHTANPPWSEPEAGLINIARESPVSGLLGPITLNIEPNVAIEAS